MSACGGDLHRGLLVSHSLADDRYLKLPWWMKLWGKVSGSKNDMVMGGESHRGSLYIKKMIIHLYIL